MSQNTKDGEIKNRMVVSSSDADGASRFFRALAVLRGVRHRHKGKLDLRESISAAREQGTAFEKWGKIGTPIKRIQVWTERQLLITVDPEIATLKSVQFDAPSRDHAVMQVLKADEGEEPVVLFNLPLDRVRTGGFDQTIDIPNGQRLRLVISPEVLGWFEMVVAFVTDETGCKLPTTMTGVRKTMAAGAGTVSNEPWKHFVRLPQSKFSTGMWACVVILSICSLTYAVHALIKHAPNITVVVREETRSPRLDNERSTNPEVVRVVSESIPGRTYKVTVRPERDRLDASSSSIRGDASSSCPSSSRQVGSPSKSERDWGPRKTSQANQFPKPDPQIDSVGMSETETEAKVTAWDPRDQSKLAAVQYVQINVDSKSSAAHSELQILQRSFIRALSQMSKWVVVGGNDNSPDAIITLGFRPEETCLGVVSFEIQDIDGKLLWRSRINCKALPKQDHDGMFEDASGRLIATLQDKLKPSASSSISTTEYSLKGEFSFTGQR